MTAVLTTIERGDLDTLEGVVSRGLDTFIEVGQALAEIRDRRLYRESHATFEEYCDQRWLLSRTRAYQFIDAAKVVDVCPPMVDMPRQRTSARPERWFRSTTTSRPWWRYGGICGSATATT